MGCQLVDSKGAKYEIDGKKIKKLLCGGLCEGCGSMDMF